MINKNWFESNRHTSLPVTIAFSNGILIDIYPLFEPIFPLFKRFFLSLGSIWSDYYCVNLVHQSLLFRSNDTNLQVTDRENELHYHSRLKGVV